METIKKAIWGDEQQNSTEPVSGETGAGTAENPYDAGNAPGIAESSKGISDGSTGGVPGETPGLGEAENRGGPWARSGGPHDSSIANKLDPRVDHDGDSKSRSGPTRFEHAVGGAASTGALNTYPSGEGHDNFNQPSSADYGTTNARDHGAGSGHGHRTGGNTSSSSTGLPSVDTSTRHETSTVGQNADYISGGGAPGAHASGISSNAHASPVAGRSQALAPIGGVGAVEHSVGADPASGATPNLKLEGAEQPLDEPDAEQTRGIKTKDRIDHSGDSLSAVDHSDTLYRKKSLVEDDGIGGPTNAKERGTGEKWIRTTGLAAEGGDFDAAKAGAGKEADRLLEERGLVRHESAPDEVHDTPGHGHDHDKVGLSQKLKDKLHIGSHKEK